MIEGQGPTGGSNKMSTSRQRDDDDDDDDDELIAGGSDEEDEPRNLASHTSMASNDVPTAVRNPPAAKLSDTKMVGAPGPKIPLSSILSINGHNPDAPKRGAPGELISTLTFSIISIERFTSLPILGDRYLRSLCRFPLSGAFVNVLGLSKHISTLI
jgi:hypothetical protein